MDTIIAIIEVLDKCSAVFAVVAKAGLEVLSILKD